MSILKNISELLDANIITEETAKRIQEYYESKPDNSQKKLVFAFSIIGALLVGLGIILIIAHNWDTMSRFSKTTIVLGALVISQCINGFAIWYKKDKPSWTEGSAIFNFLMVGASISLISQIYNLPGDMSTFLLTWMTLCLPVIYIMNSSTVSLMYLAGITCYACNLGYWEYPTHHPTYYWFLILAVLPHYYQLLISGKKITFTALHNWFIPLSFVIVLGTITAKEVEMMFFAYMALFGLMFLIGSIPFFSRFKLRNNGWRIIGGAGIVYIFLVMSFPWIWENLADKDIINLINGPQFLTGLSLLAASAAVKFTLHSNRTLTTWHPLEVGYAVGLLVFFTGINTETTYYIANVMILALGIYTAYVGGKKDSLGLFNFGLLIIIALITCRFFDTELSFVTRGIIFVLTGFGFFVANYLTFKRNKS